METRGHITFYMYKHERYVNPIGSRQSNNPPHINLTFRLFVFILCSFRMRNSEERKQKRNGTLKTGNLKLSCLFITYFMWNILCNTLKKFYNTKVLYHFIFCILINTGDQLQVYLCWFMCLLYLPLRATEYIVSTCVSFDLYTQFFVSIHLQTIQNWWLGWAGWTFPQTRDCHSVAAWKALRSEVLFA